MKIILFCQLLATRIFWSGTIRIEKSITFKMFWL